MKTKLADLLKNNLQPIAQAAMVCGVRMVDNQTFYGISVKNSVFRDAIYAEQAAIGAAVSAGYLPKDFTELYLMTNEENIIYLRSEVIANFFPESASVTIYYGSGKETTTSVFELIKKQ